jgi:tRNA pseudouridine38-40 synthase
MTLTKMKTGRNILPCNKIACSVGDTQTSSSKKSRTRIILLLEYDGSHYYGFQLQKHLPTIQLELEKALKKLTGDNIRVTSASRTDSGVHAFGQVISFWTRSSLTKQAFLGGLNYYLPHDIAVKSAFKVDESFKIRDQAISREYEYHILNRPTRSPLKERYSYLVRGDLNIETMNIAAETLVGEHDFASFASNLGMELKNTQRRIFRSEFLRNGEVVIYKITADSFLPHQVRNTVGTLIKIGLNKMNINKFNSIMDSRIIGLAGPAAPPNGLFLVKVNYKAELEEYDIENL